MQEYTEAVAALKALTEEFIQKAEEGATNRYAALEARKLSMDLRDSIKGFRKLSVQNDKSRVVPRGSRKAKEDADETITEVAETVEAQTEDTEPAIEL